MEISLQKARLAALSLALWALSALWVAPVRAQEGTGIYGVRPAVHLNLAGRGDFGFGARVDIPVVAEGFIDNIDDELAITTGGDLMIDDDGARDNDLFFVALVAPQWNFYFNQKWSAFPELGLAIVVDDDRPRDNDVDLDIYFAVGGRYHMNKRNALILRLSWPTGLQFGVSF